MSNEKAMVKHNINFLEYPLWFQDDRMAEKSESGFTWSDQAGYIYHSGYKIPTKTDGIFLLYFLLQSQMNNYAPELTISRYQVLKACNVGVDAGWYERLAESLNRWLRVDLSFSGKFFDGKDYQHMAFHILEAWKLDKTSKLLKIRFSVEFLEMMKGRGFFQYLNFNEFKKLRAPLATRLYEILSKSFYSRNIWECESRKLAQKIPMNEYYPADIIPKIQAAINRINKHTSSNFLFDVRRPERGKAILVFQKLPDSLKPVISQERNKSFAMPENDEFKALITLLPPARQSQKTILEMVQKAFKDFGCNYVARNIRYANKFAKTSYRHYLKKALELDYGLAYVEDQQAKQQESMIIAEQAHKEKMVRQAEDTIIKQNEVDRAYCRKYLDKLSPEERSAIERKAISTLEESLQSSIINKGLGWKINLEIAITKLLRECGVIMPFVQGSLNLDSNTATVL